MFLPRRVHNYVRARRPTWVEPRAGRDPRVRGGGHGGQRPRQRQQLHRPLAQAFTPRHPNLGEKPNHEPLSARGRINLIKPHLTLVDRKYWTNNPILSYSAAGDNCGERCGPSEVLRAHPRHVPHASNAGEGATGWDEPGLRNYNFQNSESWQQ